MKSASSLDRMIQSWVRLCVRIPGATRVVHPLLMRLQSRFLHRDLAARDSAGVAFHVDSRSQIEWSVLAYGCFEPELLDFLRAHLSPGMTFLDVGANIGCISLPSAKWVSPGGSVVGFEPDPAVFSRLVKNANANPELNVRTINTALGKTNGALRFFRSASDGAFSQATGSLYRSDWHDGGSELEIKVERLDGLWPAAERIDVMKIDVEGAEFDVLTGAERTLRAWRPTLLIEVCPHTAAASHWQPQQLFEFLRTMGYETFRLGKGGQPMPLVPESLDADPMTFTLIAVPPR